MPEYPVPLIALTAPTDSTEFGGFRLAPSFSHVPWFSLASRTAVSTSWATRWELRQGQCIW
ncbi:uncharacterized protein N7469_006871 [Penicillium citrinum]|uniref:Uncharacterized protein n=2 Tax=Penicillium TaxID=5073 RepID=A0A9W9TMT2_PENCI|nr:uncharacterized protein N7469_006871 [Penicillium citrinum]KAJ5226865.1 hypothetical protein N7469_006871 [Penicillium citrinum]KAJ5568679.1 hypothetical protein N7450_011165 [Penicillium hetheringtonii]